MNMNKFTVATKQIASLSTRLEPTTQEHAVT